ncbi:glutamine ABC transporter ATP-binding protein, partial [Klebsiella pneumoniae]|uniref:amino acid ABC transporter ATP-binding protein n=1 Tax=Klebsiella pneumoniae TaxID=573 RepID=UPI000DFA9B75
MTTPSAATPPAIAIAGMHKWYGDFHVLQDINLQVRAGERLVICGPSGSGKSTMIRCINRLERHQQGSIVVNGVELSDDLRAVDGVRTDAGMVFQHFNLFPHLTVGRNVMLSPMVAKRMPQDQAADLARAMLTRVGLDHKFDAWPEELSGGQQQRVAIARALAMNPPVMLFDEPTSALDATVQRRILDQLALMKQENGTSVLLITHDLALAAERADRVIVMRHGEIVEEGGARDVFERPRH